MPSTSSEIISFCESCGAYASPLLTGCPQCGWQRPAHAILPAPGMPLWKTDLGAPVRANALPFDDLVIFAWGDRESPGGVTALEQASGQVRWKVKLPYLPESGLVLCAGKVLCTTIGFLNNSAELIALNAVDGSIAWRQPLTSGGYTQPVTLNNRLVYAAAADGRIRAFDLNSGAPINGFQSQMPPGNTWLALFGDELAALCECGEIYLLAAATGKARLSQPIPTSGRISSPPILHHSRLYFGLADGRLASFDLYQRNIDTIKISERRIPVTPGMAPDLILVGSNDQHLRALDAAQKEIHWEHRFKHSPTTQAVVQHGMVFFGVRDGCLHALDAASGEPAWQFPFMKIEPEQETLVLCIPACANGIVFAGSDDGCAYALPWHMGRFEWAAQRLEANGDASQAAEFYAVAASRATGHMQRKHELSQKAVELWCQADQPERSAYYLAEQVEEDQSRVADQFRDAGKGLSSLQPEKAARLLRRAAEIYEELEDSRQAGECGRLAAKIIKAPYLSLHLITCPSSWEARKQDEISLQVKNRGNSEAQGIWLSLGGSLARRVLIELEPIKPGAEYIVYIPLIASGQGTGSLQIEARCQDAQARTWTNNRAWEMTILPPAPGITIEGDAAALVLYENTLTQNIHVKGDVGLLKVRAETPPAAPLSAAEPPPTATEAPPAPAETDGRKCPVCGQNRGESDFCDTCGITLSDTGETRQT